MRSNKKAGKPAIDANLKRGDMFYLSSMSEEGPITRKVIVLEVDNDVAVVDSWSFADKCWAQSPIAIDMTRTRYVCPATPDPDPVPAEEPPPVAVEADNAEQFPAAGGAN